MRTVALALAGMLVVAGGNLALAQDEVTVKKVTFDELGKIIKENRDKVVLVDCWHSTCIPCLKKMPELLALKKEYGPEGLVVITLHCYQNIKNDPPEADILAALKKRDMTTLNLILDETPDVWQKRMRIDNFPSVYLFTREGKWWHFSATADKPIDFDAVKKLVAEELKRKP